jgi:malonyl CoA-acyl carrier protein transacylase
VRWVDDVRWMQGQGVTQYAECGPEKCSLDWCGVLTMADGP